LFYRCHLLTPRLLDKSRGRLRRERKALKTRQRHAAELNRAVSLLLLLERGSIDVEAIERDVAVWMRLDPSWRRALVRIVTVEATRRLAAKHLPNNVVHLSNVAAE
jgi:hypothetical protein